MVQAIMTEALPSNFLNPCPQVRPQTSFDAISLDKKTPNPISACLLLTCGSSSRQAIEWLRRHTRCGLTASLEFLRLAGESNQMLRLFEEMFPAEWAASTRRLFAPSEQSPLYTEREAEFFSLVDRHIVPLNLDWIYEDEEGRTPYIPVYPLQEYDWLYNEEQFDQLPRAYQLALALNSTDAEPFEELCRLLDYESEVLPAEKINWRRLRRVMCAGNTPLKYLPTAVDVVTYSTGNPLLDWHPENGEPDVNWTIEELRWLGNLRRHGELLKLRVAYLTRWLDERDTHDRVTYAIRLWNLANLEQTTALETKEAVGSAVRYEIERFRRRTNPHADQLTLFNHYP